MRDRVLGNAELCEALAQMASAVERREDGCGGHAGAAAGGAGIARPRATTVPRHLPQTQFYLSRHRKRDPDLLKNLPNDVFIRC